MGRDERLKILLAGMAFALLILSVGGLFSLMTTPDYTVSAALSYAAGLSMIFLPCTLPLVFVIIPMTMGEGYRKGMTIALLFSLGLALTLGLYGAGVAYLGNVLGLEKESRLLFIIAGVAAYLFGLSELNLLRFSIPTFSGLPRFIHDRQEYIKAFLFGLFLGNAGVGCPNPAFYVLLTYLAGMGDVGYGGFLGFIHGLGRTTPLLFLVILALLGVNASKRLLDWRVAVQKVMGWSLIVLGNFMLVMGGLYHEWYEASFLHVAWNNILQRLTGGKLAETMEMMTPRAEHVHEQGIAPWLFLALLVIPIAWALVKGWLSREARGYSPGSSTR